MNVSQGLIGSRLIVSRKSLVIAHRGFPQLAPENTLPSFKLALDAGADLVELDYRHTRDDVPIVIHDPELNRTTNATAQFRHRHVKVASLTATEIRTLDAGHKFNARFTGVRVPLLSEALELICARSIALIERKAGDPATLVHLLRKNGLTERVVVQSFDWAFLRSLHELEPKLILAALGPAKRLPNGKAPLAVSRKLNRAWLRHVPGTGAHIVVWSQRVSKGVVQLLHNHGLRIWVYTVNHEKLANRLLHAGVDGIITNNPLLIQRISRA